MQAAGRRIIEARGKYVEAAQAIASRLFKAEGSLETAALDLNNLHTGLIEGRRAAGLSASVGHDLLHETSQAQAAVDAALAAVARVHHASGRQVKELGLPRLDFGQGGNKPNADTNPDYFGGA